MPAPTVVHKPHGGEFKGSVYCPLCTHTVQATVLSMGRSAKVVPGQKCSRCQSSLDAGYVIRLVQAA